RNWAGADAARTCTRLYDEFTLLWGGGDNDCVVVDLPEALSARLMQDYKSDRMPTEADFHRLWRRAQGLPDEVLASPETNDLTFRIPDWLDYRSGDYAHQGNAMD